MHVYRKKAIIYLFVMMIIFLLVFLLAFLNLERRVPTLSLGMGYMAESMLLMLLSLVSIVKIVIELVRIEHHRAFERRIRN